MESYSAMMKRYRAEGLFPLEENISDEFLKEFLLPVKSRLRKSNAPLSSQQRLLLRYGFGLKHKFHKDYPTEASNINTMTYGERLRAEQAERSRVAREAYIEREKKSAAAKAYQMRMRREFGIGRKAKSAMASAEVFADMPQSPSALKKMVMTISNGIQNAFGGKELTRLAKIFGISKGVMGAFGAVWALKKYAQMTMAAARNGAQLSWTSAYTGTTVDKMAGMVGALSAFGGSGKSAAKLYGMINQIKQGTLVGKQNPWEDAIRQYGLNLTTGGTNQWKSDEEIIKEISNRLAGLSPRAAADLAQSLHLDQSQFNLLRGGYENFKSRVQFANEGNPFADHRLAESFEYTTEQANILGNELKKLGANLAATDMAGTITGFWAEFFHALNTGSSGYFKEGWNNFLEGMKNTISHPEDYDTTFFKGLHKKAGYKWYDAAAGTEFSDRRDDKTKRYFEELFKNHRAPQIREKIYELMPGLYNPARDRWIENYDFYRKGYEHPIDGGTTNVNPKVSLNLGDIHLKSGGEDAIRMAVVDNIDWGFAPTAIAKV